MDHWLMLTFLDAEHLPHVARKAEECGYRGVMLSEHLLYPYELFSSYPHGETPFTDETPFFDIWTTFAALSQHTAKLEFISGVCVVPLRSPLLLARQIGTASALSGGRVLLGTGVGWMEEEYVQTGQDFHTRGARMDEAIDVIRLVWAGDKVEYHGSHYDFGPLRMSRGCPDPLPIIVGGDSEPALRRAATKGDGWVGSFYTPDDAEGYVRRLGELREEAGASPDDPFEIILGCFAESDVEACRRMGATGVSGMVTAPWGPAYQPDLTRDEILAATEAYAERVIART